MTHSRYSMSRSFLVLRVFRDSVKEVVALRRELGVLRATDLKLLELQNDALRQYAAGLIGGYNVPWIRLPRFRP